MPKCPFSVFTVYIYIYIYIIYLFRGRKRLVILGKTDNVPRKHHCLRMTSSISIISMQLTIDHASYQ